MNFSNLKVLVTCICGRYSNGGQTSPTHLCRDINASLTTAVHPPDGLLHLEGSSMEELPSELETKESTLDDVSEWSDASDEPEPEEGSEDEEEELVRDHLEARIKAACTGQLQFHHFKGN